MTPRLLVLALSSALSASFALPAVAQDPPPKPTPQPAPADRDTSDTAQNPVQLEQDALDPVGTDPAQDPMCFSHPGGPEVFLSLSVSRDGRWVSVHVDLVVQSS